MRKAEGAFKRAFNMENVQDAILLLGGLVGKPIEEEEIVRYDTKTGDPVDTGKFKPYKAWDGVLWLNSFGNEPSLDEKAILYAPLMQAVKRGDTVSIGDFIVQHIPERSEGGSGSMGDQGGTVEAHLWITKPRRL